MKKRTKTIKVKKDKLITNEEELTANKIIGRYKLKRIKVREGIYHTLNYLYLMTGLFFGLIFRINTIWRFMIFAFFVGLFMLFVNKLFEKYEWHFLVNNNDNGGQKNKKWI